jgi:hypothetical protein
MRADLVPVTSAALERIKLLLLNMARQATLVALDDITARVQQLEARPTQLDDFVSYMVSSCNRFSNQLCHQSKVVRRHGCVPNPTISCVQGWPNSQSRRWANLCTLQFEACTALQARPSAPVRPVQLAPFLAAHSTQVLHNSQLDDRQQLTGQCSHVDEMYESLAAHEQKVATKDQVKHEDLTNELANFQNQLVLVSAAPTECPPFTCTASGVLCYVCD